jgi:ubiquinone/menaquinone biosynthesis C-methylase UbiE
MAGRKTKGVDYSDKRVREDILVRQRRGMWTPEQIASLAAHFRLRPGMKMLDAGCGYGYCLRTYGHYCMPGGELIGLDLESNLVETARSQVEDEGLGAVSSFTAGNIYAMPFSNDTFDVTVCHVVMCHLSEPAKALDELIRVTRPGGCVAVFDNANAGGQSGVWHNTFNPTIPQWLFLAEAGRRWLRGRKKLGHGEFSVGFYLPGWMEERGLKDVNARQNERVRWIAPPYRSPGQQVELKRAKERMAMPNWVPMIDKPAVHRRRMLAGGASPSMIDRSMASGKRHVKRMRDAMARGTLAYMMCGSFVCVWGFK